LVWPLENFFAALQPFRLLYITDTHAGSPVDFAPCLTRSGFGSMFDAPKTTLETFSPKRPLLYL
jgi:hypothetical protein